MRKNSSISFSLLTDQLHAAEKTNAVGKSIKELRKFAELKQAVLGSPLSLTDRVLSKIETGQRQPKFLEIVAIAIILQVPLSELVPEPLRSLLPKSN